MSKSDVERSTDEPPHERQRRLRTLFLDATGTDVLVEPRTASTGRRVADEVDAAVAEDVDAAARNDGLTDAITVPEVDTSR